MQTGGPEDSGDDVGLPSAARENIEVLASFAERENAATSRVSVPSKGSAPSSAVPPYFAFVLLFILAWVLTNGWWARLGRIPFDQPPYPGCRAS